MNQAIEVLDREHRLIKKALDKARTELTGIREGYGSLKDFVRWVDFFKNYADSYHHNKEERVLFPEMCRRNEMLQYGVVQEMLENHADFREMLSDMAAYAEQGDADATWKKFDTYAEALLEHIAVEDEEVFQIAETLMSEDELRTVLYLFEDCDRELGMEGKIRFEDLDHF